MRYLHNISLTEEQLKDEWITQDQYDNEIKYLTEDYDEEMKWHSENILRIEKNLSFHKNNLENESSDLTSFIIIFLVLQILWRIFCEWWGRWFSFLNVTESSSVDSNTTNSTNKLKDFALLKAYIAVPYYTIVYLLMAIGVLGILVYFYSLGLETSILLELTLYIIVFQLFLRLYFEMAIALFRYLKRR